MVPRVDTAPHGVETPTPLWWIADWLGLVEPAAAAKDGVSPPHHNVFHTSTPLTIRGRKGRSPGSIPPGTVWKTQAHWLIAGWLGLVEQTAPGGDRIPPPKKKQYHTSKYNSDNPGIKTVIIPPASIPPRTVWKAQLRVHQCWRRSAKAAIFTHWGRGGSASSLTMIY